MDGTMIRTESAASSMVDVRGRNALLSRRSFRSIGRSSALWWLLFLTRSKVLVVGWTWTSTTRVYPSTRAPCENSLAFVRSTSLPATATTEDASKTSRPRRRSSDPAEGVDEEGPAGIAGAEFFGGNKQKIEFFDPEAEAAAALSAMSILQEDTSTAEPIVYKDRSVNPFLYHRFADRAAFSSNEVAQVAFSLQTALNQVLYSDVEKSESDYISYDPDRLLWSTPFAAHSSGAKTPLEALSKALDFYPRLDVAIVSGTTCNSAAQSERTYELRWEMSLVWPTLWAPRVLLTGSSTIVVEESTVGGAQRFVIISQSDQLDSPDLLSSISAQVAPRFWDLYHIFMTPSAEWYPRISSNILPTQDSGGKAAFLNAKDFTLYELPPRLVYRAAYTDVSGTRDDGNADVVPHFAFTTAIRTMGPTKQRFVPTNPVEVQIAPLSQGGNRLTWTVPVSVEFLTNAQMPLPETPGASGVDGPSTSPEFSDPLAAAPTCEYQYQPRRLVAVTPYGGYPQDEKVAEIRQKLYEQVVERGGYVPVLTEDGRRPVFFFWSSNTKACFSADGGFGMTVYEWRPSFVQSNYVGLELQFPPGPE
jgi:hypothetical protein